MKMQQKPPRPKGPAKRKHPESTEGKRPDEKEAPASAERIDDEPAASTERKPGDTSSQRDPVTNQDEQDRITNAGDDLPPRQ